MDELRVVGTITSAAEGLRLKVRDATTSIVHEDRTDVEVRVNNPDNWQIDGATIEQTAVAEGNSISISITGDGNDVFVQSIQGSIGSIIGGSFGGGSMVIGGRRIEVKDGELLVNGKRQKDAPAPERVEARIMASVARLISKSRSSFTINGIKIEADDEGVYRNGKKQMDAEEDEVVEGGEKPEEQKPDVIVVAVPRNFQGSLHLDNQGMAPLTLDGWIGGDFVVTNRGNGKGIVTGPVSGVDSFSVNLSSMGGFDFESAVQCRKAEPKVTGNGNLSLASVTADELDARVTSMGKLSFEGAVAIKGRAGITLTGNGGVKLHDALSAHVLEMAARSMGGFTVEGAVTITEGAKLNLTGNGPAKLESGITAGMLDMTAGSMGGFKIGGKVHVVGQTNVVLTGNGDARFEEPVESGSFSGRLSSMGGLRMEELGTGELNLTTSGMGSAKIDSGSCSSGSLRASGMGGITVRGDFRNLKQSRSGMGDIKVKNG